MDMIEMSKRRPIMNASAKLPGVAASKPVIFRKLTFINSKSRTSAKMNSENKK